MNDIPRGTLARKSRAKKLALRQKQDLSDLATNTRKRRRLARRLFKEQPLFAYPILSTLITGYDLTAYKRDTRPTTHPRSARRKGNRARIEFHNELLSKLPDATDNKVLTRLIINWENVEKPFVFLNVALNIRYMFPTNWSLNKIRTASMEMSKFKTLKELDDYWNAATSYGN